MSKQRLQQNQQQKLSFQQIQFFKMLAMSQDELEKNIKKEIEENPAIEEIIDEQSKTPFYHKTYNTDSNYSKEIPENNKTLNEHVIDQIKFEKLNKKEKSIAKFIIGSLEDSGYLHLSALEIKNDLFVHVDIDVEIEEINRIIQIIQKLEPSGIAASNLQECLLVQIKKKPESSYTLIAEKILKSYFNDFINKNYTNLLKKLEINKETLRNAELEITKLSPKPGLAFNNTEDRQIKIYPDLILIKKNDTLKIELTKENYYNLKLSNSFSEILNKKEKNQEVMKFIKDKIENAKNFIDNLNNRNLKILNTANAILEIQKSFFETGDIKNIIPMKLVDIQKITKDHLSSISRIINKKYIETYFGIFKLKSFFSIGFLMNNGKEISPKIIKEEIKNIIETEDPSKPYKDEKISDLLNNKNIIISRRTISKYRKQIKILPSKLRQKI